MTATTRIRGHLAVWRDSEWRWSDTGLPATDERPCPKCGEVSAKGGPDPCIGYMDGVSAACCGHGVSEPYALTSHRAVQPDTRGESR